MIYLWSTVTVLFAVTKLTSSTLTLNLSDRVISASSSISSNEEDFPLTKSLGFSIKRQKNLEDSISKEFAAKYQEMKIASQESFENFHMQEKRLRRVVDDDGYDLAKEVESYPKRRSSNKLQSMVGKRRARSQAARREKLNTQSLRSHMHYSKMSNLEFGVD